MTDDTYLGSIRQQRLRNQMIDVPRADEDIADVLSHMVAIQAQDYTGMKWSFGLRTTGVTERDVERSIERAEIVRTWLLRGTLHIASAVDVRWLLAVAGPPAIARGRALYAQKGLDESVVALSQTVMVECLKEGRRAIRQEIVDAFQAAGIETSDQRGYLLIVRAALDGLICLGPMQGKQQTFVLLDEWLPVQAPITKDAASLHQDLAKRYITSRGPVTLQDFTYWSGLSVGEARAAVASLSADIETVRFGDGEFLTARAPSQTAPSGLAQSAYLLPGFDEYLLGYADRSAVLAPEYRQLVCPGGNAVYKPTVCLDGQIVGIWSRSTKKSEAYAITITLFPGFEDIPMATFDQAIAQFERYAL